MKKTKQKNSNRKTIAERASMALMALGIIMVCQPFWHELFRWGFLVTILGIIFFTVAGHLPADSPRHSSINTPSDPGRGQT